MAGLGDAYLRNVYSKKGEFFNLDLFKLSHYERIAKYGRDDVLALRSMSITERIKKYGRDFEEFLKD